jgi:hypothetical protein
MADIIDKLSSFLDKGVNCLATGCMYMMAGGPTLQILRHRSREALGQEALCLRGCAQEHKGYLPFPLLTYIHVLH